VGCDIAINRTHDAGLVRDIVGSCWDTIAEDGQEFSDWYPNTAREAYLLATVDKRPAGILTVSSANASLLHVHPHILPEERRHRIEVGRAWVDYVTEHAPFRAMVAYIPEIYRHVIWFACSLGFEGVGTARRGFLKDGELHDMRILQLEMERG